MKSFKDKIVVITGAGSGMGRAYAVEFAKLGTRLALNDYNTSTLAETVSLLQLPPSHIYSQAFDVSKKDEMFDFAANVQEKLGNAHVIINNAGIEGSAQPFATTSIEEYQKIMDINFYGVLYGTKAFLPQLMDNKEGAIVNVSSIFGLAGFPHNTDYCASKFAVRGFTEALSVELLHSPISVHCVHPGGIKTNIVKNEKALEFSKKYLITPPEDIAKHVIECIKKNRPKIVYGNGSLKTWIASNWLPQKVLNYMIAKEMGAVMKE